MREHPPRRMVGGRRRARRDLLMPPFHETYVTSVVGGTAPDLQVRAREDAAMRQRVSSPTFAGRVGERELLRATLERVAAGSAATVLVGGDAGIGKSRLVTSSASGPAATGRSSPRGVCVPTRRRRPALRTGRRVPPRPRPPVGRQRRRRRSSSRWRRTRCRPGRVRDRRAAAPGRRRAGQDAAVRVDPGVLRRPGRAVAGRAGVRGPAVGRLGQRRAARASSPATSPTARCSLSAPTAATSSAATTSLRPVAERARPPPPGHADLPLDGLDRDEMAEMIGGILGQRPDWTLVDAVWARSQGNPFFAEELTAARHEPVAVGRVPQP